MLYWFEIAVMAVACLLQEIRGEDPDCPKCWKCEMMRVLTLCLVAGSLTALLKWVL